MLFLLYRHFIVKNFESFRIWGLTSLFMKSSAFWDITPCSPMKSNRHFGETSRLNLQSRKIRQAKIEHEAVSKESPLTASSRVLALFLNNIEEGELFLRNVG
jgi:hypothetical protein